MLGQTNLREGLLKYRLGKKEKEYVDIQNFRLIFVFRLENKINLAHRM